MRESTVILLLLVTSAFGLAEPPSVAKLASQIDARIDAKLREAKVPPSRLADDAEFLRRVSLDLTGRIPTPHEVYEFLKDTSPDKQAKLVDELLESPRHAAHFAAVWRAALAPETSALPEARVFRPGFEAWLKLQFRANVPMDQLVRELLTVPLSADPRDPTPVLQRPDAPNPLAFFAVKEAKPENLAAVTTRVFLGVQIECAQCHNHPFAGWTQEQFWNQAAFFAGVERSRDGLFAPVMEKRGIKDISPGEGKKRVSAAFLDETVPGDRPDVSLRAELANWVTSKKNPFFAKATANRIWGQLFGRGIVDPVDDFNSDNPPSHPELLDELAEALIVANFDQRFLIRAITRSQAYRRTSAQTDPSQTDPRLLARMAVKGLTGEQLYDSLIRATGFREPATGGNGPREEFLNRFALTGSAAEPETSIPQALALMNGRFVADATTVASSPTLLAASEIPNLAQAERIELLYISALGRKPTAQEQARVKRHLAEAGTGLLTDRLADVFWALLNCAEFRLNH